MDQNEYDFLINLLKHTNDSKDIPVTAIIVDWENNVVASGFNTREKTFKIHGHAEINAINELMSKIKNNNLSEYKIITLLEPCSMCYSAALQAKIPTIEYLLENDKNTLTRSISFHNKSLNLKKVGTKQQEEKYSKILNDFFNNNLRK